MKDPEVEYLTNRLQFDEVAARLMMHEKSAISLELVSAMVDELAVVQDMTDDLIVRRLGLN